MKGVTDGCIQAGCALIGARPLRCRPPEDEYDLAGFVVGMVDRDRIIAGKTIGRDVLIGLASSEVHSTASTGSQGDCAPWHKLNQYDRLGKSG